MNLNASQIKAVQHVNGPLLVLAGPGSGKTLVITQRIKYLIQHCQIPEESILVVSFSRASAIEMKNRFLAHTKRTSCKTHFSTFHSLFFSILREFGSIKKDDVIKFSQQYEIILQWRRRFYKQEIEKLGHEFITQEEEIKNCLDEINRYKNQIFSSTEFNPINLSKKEFSSLIRFYEKVKKYNHKIDFHDMEIECLLLLRQQEKITKILQKRFTYSMVDEFQDINDTQFQIMKLISGPLENFFAVGDEDQSIYQFRGACPQIMLDFAEKFSFSSRVVLEQNYRSGKSIVEFSQKLIGHNLQRFQKNIVWQENHKDEGVHCHLFEDEKNQADWIIQTLDTKIKKGQSIEQDAILFRTHACGSFLAARLFEQKIPFRLSGFLADVHQHFIGKDILAYFRLAHSNSNGINKSDFLRVANKPLRYIPHNIFEGVEATWENGMNFFSSQNKDWMCERMEEFRGDLKHISFLSPYAGILYLYKAMGYEQYLQTISNEQDEKIDQWKEVLNEILEFARAYKSNVDWLEGIQLYQQRLQTQEQPLEGISLMTMHGSKGLEFKEVYLIDIVEGIVPYKKALSHGMEEEERRIFYVAMTRAQEKLEILSTKKRNSQLVGISRFVNELDS